MEACRTKRRSGLWPRTLVASVFCLALSCGSGPRDYLWSQGTGSQGFGVQANMSHPETDRTAKAWFEPAGDSWNAVSPATVPLPRPIPDRWADSPPPPRSLGSDQTRAAEPLSSDRQSKSLRPTAVPRAESVADSVESYREQGRFQGPIYVTRNFRVQAASPALAQAVGDRAEGYRELLAIQWLGQALPDWPQACPIQVNLSHQAHGETSFLLPENGQGLPSDWDMKVYGPSDRLLDSVLPHEITHTIFATYFRQRLPRWADEGACTTVEHPSEREKIQALLIRFLSPQQRQGIPFNRMFPMRDYPADMLPLYAQGYSVAKFLIAQGGPRHFTSLIERGLHYERSLPVTAAWDQAMREAYGYEDLSDLQLDWLQWVSEGSQDSMAVARLNQRNQLQLAAAESPEAPRPEPPSHHVLASADVNFYVQQSQQPNPAAAPPWEGTDPREGAFRTGVPSADPTADPRPGSPEFSPVAPVRLAAPIQANHPAGQTLPAGQNQTAGQVGPAGQIGVRSDSTILLPRRLR